MASARSAYCRACAPSSASRAAIWENRSVWGERLSITGWPQKATLLPFRKASRESSPCAAWRNGYWTITLMDAVWVFPSIWPGAISPPAACISWPPSELFYAHLRPTPKSAKRWKLSSACCARSKKTSLLSFCFCRLFPNAPICFTACAPFSGSNRRTPQRRSSTRSKRPSKASLRRKRPERGPAKDTREAIDLILEHLDRHGPYLWGHAIRLPRRVGGGIRLIARTNNGLESLFHTIKHGERRRSDRKILTQDFEVLPPAAALATNLHHADYVSRVCGSLDRLPEAFAALDAPHRSRSIAVGAKQSSTTVETASLNTIDKRFVRRPIFEEYILSAAKCA